MKRRRDQGKFRLYALLNIQTGNLLTVQPEICRTPAGSFAISLMVSDDVNFTPFVTLSRTVIEALLHEGVIGQGLRFKEFLPNNNLRIISFRSRRVCQEPPRKNESLRKRGN